MHTPLDASHERSESQYSPQPLPRRRNFVPFGIDVRATSISIAICSRTRDTAVLERALTVPTDGDPDRALGELIGKLREEARHDALSTLYRRLAPAHFCAIGSVAPEFLKTAPFALPAKFPAHERTRAAQLEIQKVLPLTPEQRTVRLRELENGSFSILATRKQDVLRAAATIERAGARVRAIDCAPQAWSRLLRDPATALNGGLIEDDPVAPLLVVHAEGQALCFSLPPNSDDRTFIAALKQHLTQTLQSRRIDDTTLTYWSPGSTQRYELVARELPGFVVKPLVIDRTVMPTWAYAYALATWSLF